MTKAKIVIFSIFIFLIALISVLFGAVFRIRNQTVLCLGEDVSYCESLKEKILSSSGIKNGKSTFMLDKDTAINNIEKANPYIKVIQIKTTGVTEIEIQVRKRYETYYLEANDKFYIVDEELKVLQVIENTEPKPEFVKIKTDIEIGEGISAGDFVLDKYTQDITSKLYIALYTNALKDRNELYQHLSEISFDKGLTLSGEYVRLILTTVTGVKMDICVPEENLNEKVNICFSVYEDDEFTEEFKQSGTIKIYLDEEGNQKVGYFE